jgi:hypothetical protein
MKCGLLEWKSRAERMSVLEIIIAILVVAYIAICLYDGYVWIRKWMTQ